MRIEIRASMRKSSSARPGLADLRFTVGRTVAASTTSRRVAVVGEGGTLLARTLDPLRCPSFVGDTMTSVSAAAKTRLHRVAGDVCRHVGVCRRAKTDRCNREVSNVSGRIGDRVGTGQGVASRAGRYRHRLASVQCQTERAICLNVLRQGDREVDVSPTVKAPSPAAAIELIVGVYRVDRRRVSDRGRERDAVTGAVGERCLCHSDC